MSDEPAVEDEVEAVESVAEPAQVERRTRRIKMTQARADGYLRQQLASVDGRRWLWGLMQECGTFEDRFGSAPNGAPDVRVTDFQAGQRSVGLRIWRTLARVDPAALGVMHHEHDGTNPELPNS